MFFLYILSYYFVVDVSEKIYQCMLALSVIDGHVDKSEKEILSRFKKHKKIQFSISPDELVLRERKDIESFFEEGLKHLLIASESEQNLLFDLFHYLNELAFADKNFHKHEKLLLLKLKEYLGNNVKVGKDDFEWTPKQLEVLNENTQSRLLVEAPPGAGKTELVAEKVYRLISEQKVLPKNIFLVSFTNTAVYEMKHRIFSKFNHGSEVRGINLTTLDKNAFQVNSTLRDSYALDGDYETSLEKLQEIIEGRNYDFMEDWEEMEHVFIDEAQDFHGLRRDICIDLLKSLSPSAGFTILGDPCQQIYGWDAKDENEKKNLLDVVQNNFKKIKYIELNSIHRTNDITLIQILDDMRAEIYIDEGPIESPLNKIDFVEFDLKNSYASDDYLFLFRSNDDVMHTAFNVTVSKKLFRLRSGSNEKFPKYYYAWLGKLISFFKDKEINLIEKSDFMDFFDSNEYLFKNASSESVWDDMRIHAAEGFDQVSLEKLILALSSSQVLAFSNPGLGFRGPLLSTIHASKGTQSANVLIKDFTKSKTGFIDNSDESKVVFVGISRAQKSVKKINSTYQVPKYLKTMKFIERKSNLNSIILNRKFRMIDSATTKQRTMIPTYIMEIGLKNDYDPLSIVSTEVGMEEAKKTQAFLQSLYLGNEALDVIARRKDIVNEEFHIEARYRDQVFKLGWFHNQVINNLKSVSHKHRNMYIPPIKMDNFQVIDIATYFYDESSLEPKEFSKILKPFREKKVWLIPIFYSLARFQFNKLKR